MLDEARVRGLGRSLLLCGAGNIASARTIDRNGGVLDGVRDTEHGAVRRHRITFPPEIQPPR
ncbi:hypothetical protein ACIP98_03420 [Streptomyces sp. NPDC088354]|nr:hypothetical protein [Streptomyces sp. MI02-7b]